VQLRVGSEGERRRPAIERGPSGTRRLTRASALCLPPVSTAA
jgi:hypothetical protein